MFTEPGIFRNFFIKFYNFGGVFCIKIQNGKLLNSKFQAIFNIFKIILGIAYQNLYMSHPNIKSFIYDDEVAFLKNYSKFSFNILGITVISFQYCISIFVFLQSKRHRKVTKFINMLLRFDGLTKPYSTIFKNNCIKNFILVQLILLVSSVPQFFGFLTLDKKIGIILHMLSFFIWIPSVAFVHFLEIFKSYLILNIKQIKNDLSNWEFKEKIVLKNLNQLKIIAEIMAEFHKVFDIQLTVMSTECAAMFTLMVK